MNVMLKINDTPPRIKARSNATTFTFLYDAATGDARAMSEVHVYVDQASTKMFVPSQRTL